MDVRARLAGLRFFRPLPDWAVDVLAARSQVVELAAGELLARQHEKADTAHFLCRGKVQVLLRFEGTGDLVTEVLTPEEPAIGWSVFRPPYRYTSSIRCETAVEALAVPRTAFEEIFATDPGLEPIVLAEMAEVVADRLENTLKLLVGEEPETPETHADPAAASWRGDPTPSDLRVLEAAPFFEVFSRTELDHMADHAEARRYPAGAELFSIGQSADWLNMLVSGRVRLSYAAGDPRLTPAVDYQTISEPGRVIGWSALVEPSRYRATAAAATPVRVLAFDRRALLDAAMEHPALGARLMRQVLHLLGGRLREAAMRVIARRYDDEVVAIRALIDQHAEELTVGSPLHKLPLFLANRATVPDAIAAMELLAVQGDEVERSLAGSCLDLMANIKRELAVFQGLQGIYHSVATAAPESSPEQLRNSCAARFAEVFENTAYIVAGLEHLPDSPGNIFVMNHLTNDEANKFPSGFRLTIDTHFVSSMILYPKYGRAPVRVVRQSAHEEYGHQMYYDRLGYIYVQNGWPGASRPDAATAAERRAAFFRDAGRRLRRGDNLVVCPEGDCTTTEESPLPFRSGAFRLAIQTEPEPLIVPISVAYFDKALTRHTLAATVHRPFRMSEVLPEGSSDADLFEWTASFRSTFAQWVRETRDLADGATTASAGLHVPRAVDLDQGARRRGPSATWSSW